MTGKGVKEKIAPLLKMHKYKINQSRNGFQEYIKSLMSKHIIGASDFALFFKRNEPDAKPIIFLCLKDIYDGESDDVTDGDLKIIENTKYYECWGNERLGGRISIKRRTR